MSSIPWKCISFCPFLPPEWNEPPTTPGGPVSSTHLTIIQHIPPKPWLEGIACQAFLVSELRKH